jgi:hypothetical protein
MGERSDILDELAALLAVPRDTTTPANLHGSATFFGAGPAGQLPSPQSQELCRVHGDWRSSRSWQVTLYPPNRYPALSGGRDVRSADVEDSFARIQFASGGPPAEVDIDWRQGGVYMFAAAQISVTAVSPTLPLDVAGIPEPMTLQASISPTTRTNMLTPTRSITYPDLAPLGGSFAKAIPPFARSVFFERWQTDTVEFVALEFMKMDGTVIVSRWLQLPLFNNFQERFVIPAEATFLQITNDDALVILEKPLAIYELAL